MSGVNVPGQRKGAMDTAMQGLQIASTVSSIKNNMAQTDAINRRIKKSETAPADGLSDSEEG